MAQRHPAQNRKDTPLLHMPLNDRQDWRAFYETQFARPVTDDTWGAMCEGLWRSGHGFPATFGSAIAHQLATPKSERLDIREAPIGSAVFYDDPRDSNPFGHITGLWARKSPTDIDVATNDVRNGSYEYGSVSVVPHTWFKANWGDDLQFATLWCGPYKVEVVGGKVVPPKPPTGRQDTAALVHRAINNAEQVVDLVKKAIKDNDGKIRHQHEVRLHQELRDQQQNLRDLRHLLPNK